LTVAQDGFCRAFIAPPARAIHTASHWFLFWFHKSVSSPIFIGLWGAGCVKGGVNLSEFVWQLGLERAKTRKCLIDLELWFFFIRRFFFSVWTFLYWFSSHITARGI
jgi:hypothetical protein